MNRGAFDLPNPTGLLWASSNPHAGERTVKRVLKCCAISVGGFLGLMISVGLLVGEERLEQWATQLEGFQATSLYRQAMVELIERNQSSLAELPELLENARPRNEIWVREFRLVAAGFSSSYEEARTLTPPETYMEAHTLMLSALEKQIEAVEMVEVFIESDADEIPNSGLREIDATFGEGGPLLRRAFRLLPED